MKSIINAMTGLLHLHCCMVTVVQSIRYYTYSFILWICNDKRRSIGLCSGPGEGGPESALWISFQMSRRKAKKKPPRLSNAFN